MLTLLLMSREEEKMNLPCEKENGDMFLRASFSKRETQQQSICGVVCGHQKHAAMCETEKKEGTSHVVMSAFHGASSVRAK